MQIQQVDPEDKQQIKDFISLPFRLNKDCEQWVPPFIMDVKKMLNPQKHPFYEHSEAEFFLVEEQGEVLGRVGLIENRPYNQVHDSRQGFFTMFDCIEDQQVANVLFERVFERARKRGLNRLVGEKGLGAFDGYGVLVSGFEHHQMMTMMRYNYPYYGELIEHVGFDKEVDFVSCYIPQDKFKISEKVKEIARRIKERGTFEVHNFRSKRELAKWAWKIGQTYNKAFVDNWEYYPLSKGEIKQVVDDLLTIADPRLIKIITHKEEVVGFLLGFLDITPALQRNGGRITPWGVADMMLEMRRAKGVTFNGTGILPQYQGRGGNALMYSEMEKTIHSFNFEYIDMPQVAETAVQMRKDLKNLGGIEYKNHRVYQKNL